MPNKRTPGKCEGCGAPVPPPKRKCRKCKRATARAAYRRRGYRSAPVSRGAAGSYAERALRAPLRPTPDEEAADDRADAQD